jgi:hypothetical protein
LDELIRIAEPLFQALAAEIEGARAACGSSFDWFKGRMRYIHVSPLNEPSTFHLLCQGNPERLDVARALRAKAEALGMGDQASRNNVYSLLDSLFVTWAKNRIDSLSSDALDILCPRPLGIELALRHGVFPGTGRDEVILKTRGLLDVMVDIATGEQRLYKADFPAEVRRAFLDRLLVPGVLRSRGTMAGYPSYTPSEPCCLLLAQAGYDFGPVDSSEGQIWMEPIEGHGGKCLAESVLETTSSFTRAARPRIPDHVARHSRFLEYRHGYGALRAWECGYITAEETKPWWDEQFAGKPLLHHLLTDSKFALPRDRWLELDANGNPILLANAFNSNVLEIAPEETSVLFLKKWVVLFARICRKGIPDGIAYLKRAAEAASSGKTTQGEVLQQIGKALTRWSADEFVPPRNWLHLVAVYWQVLDPEMRRERWAASMAEVQLQNFAVRWGRKEDRPLVWQDGTPGLEILLQTVKMPAVKRLAQTVSGRCLLSNVAGVDQTPEACMAWMEGVRARGAATEALRHQRNLDGEEEPEPML